MHFSFYLKRKVRLAMKAETQMIKKIERKIMNEPMNWWNVHNRLKVSISLIYRWCQLSLLVEITRNIPLIWKKIQIKTLTCWKLIILHCVPVVQSPKDIDPLLPPDGADCVAIQFTSAVLLDPSLYSRIQALKPLWSTDSTQMAPPLPRVGLLIERLSEARTVTSCPPWKGVANETCWQANSPGETVVTLALPALKMPAI